MNKRKSLGRRRTRSLGRVTSKDLCETISKSLLPSERLLSLLELSFHYALSVVQKEIRFNSSNIYTLQKKGTECWEKIRILIEKADLHSTAVASSVLPCNSSMQMTSEEYDEVNKMLKMESDNWSSQISQYRNALEKEINSPYEVHSAEWNGKDLLYDYSTMVQEISSQREKLSEDIAVLPYSESILTRLLHMNNNFNCALQLKSKKCFKQEGLDTPRTLIKKLRSAKKITKLY